MDTLEAITNVVLGYVLAVLTQVVCFPWFGLEAAPAEHLGLGLIFTAVSLCRSYGLRKLFRRMETRHVR